MRFNKESYLGGRMKKKLTDASLTLEERQILKQEIDLAWPEFPIELKQYLIEAMQLNLKTLYMLQNWAKNNGHETMLDIVSRKIIYKEERVKHMESSL